MHLVYLKMIFHIIERAVGVYSFDWCHVVVKWKGNILFRSIIAEREVPYAQIIYFDGIRDLIAGVFGHPLSGCAISAYKYSGAHRHRNYDVYSHDHINGKYYPYHYIFANDRTLPNARPKSADSYFCTSLYFYWE